MIKNKRTIMFLTGLVILTSPLKFNAQTKTPLYYEASGNASLVSYNSNSIDSSRKTAITETVQKVSPAVVGINVTEIQQYSSPFSNFFNDPFFQQFFGNQGTYNQKVKELGSGFLISPDGYIVTNDHVAGNASEITVTLTNGKEYKAKLIGTDHATDICLLKIEGHNLPYVTLGNSDGVMIGEWVIAFGNPFGLFNVNDKPTVTVGVISSTGMNLEPINNRYYLNMLQTDAAINGGNSGGPLANSLGEVIGMNTLIYTAGGVQGNIGLGFAIPINRIKKVITELKEYGKIDRNFNIGLKIQTVDEGIAKYYKLPSVRGVIVTEVIPNSPASMAGIKSGDIILQVNDYKIIDDQTLVGVFKQFRSGQTITLKLLRDNKEITKQMNLEKTIND
ncbi:MAG TPA: trypsin-like peptidase domain-containing protein [Ignavibacteriaceae bacterium]|nr:trypsin-like peptidase domain-containing protein [Ignavibacteriaceae bacterium]